MRIGGGIEKRYDNPESWLELVKELGYSAVIAPVDSSAPIEDVHAYKACAEQNGILIAEVGVWRNIIAPDEQERKNAVEYAKRQLALADELGANCCVNISGSRGEIWDGCYEDNYSQDTYARVIDSVREVIDSVKPKRTFYALETMPWMHPDSPESYLRLIDDIDRGAFGVHLDYANMINSVEKYIKHKDFITHCFNTLAPYIKSVHAKDVRISRTLPCNITEVPPGEGVIDYGLVARFVHSLGEDMPLIIEHLSGFEQYKAGARYVRSSAQQNGVPVK